VFSDRSSGGGPRPELVPIVGDHQPVVAAAGARTHEQHTHDVALVNLTELGASVQL